MGSMFFLWLMQMCLSFLVLQEVIRSPPEEDVWSKLPESTMLVTSRFICGIVLHVLLQTELDTAMSHMKFAVNHPWKF